MLNIEDPEKYISKKELHAVLDDIPLPVILTETDKTIRYANRQALNMGGYKSLVGLKCIDTFCNQCCSCPTDGNSHLQDSEQLFYKYDGTSLPVRKKAHLVSMYDENFYVQFFHDLSEQHNSEKQLIDIIREKEDAEIRALNESRKFEQLFEGMNESVYVHELDGKIIKVNKAASLKMGYSVQELESMSILDLVAPQLLPRSKERFNNLVAQENMDFESVHMTKDGKSVPVEVRVSVVDFDGRKIALGTARDISVRKEMENELIAAKHASESNEEELNAIFNQVPSTIIILDMNGKVSRVNEQGIKIFNINRNEFFGKAIGSVLGCINSGLNGDNCGFSEKCPKCQLQSSIRNTINFGVETIRKEMLLSIKENDILTDKTVLLSTAALKNNGEGYIVTIDDITDRKKIEQELIYAKQKAEISEKLKTAFLNNISHEIRTPLNGLLGFLDFFENDYDHIPADERRTFINIMRKSGDRLLNTVTDIIEASKLDIGIVDFTKEYFNLKKVLEDFVDDFKIKYVKQEIEFVYSIDPQLDNVEIETDKSKLLRTLKNLLDNAFKFTNSGKVTLQVKKEKNRLFFSVKDTGIGIAASDVEVIFTPFRQLDINLSRAFEGNGLGLTIANKLVKYLGGELKVKSEIGKGSEFFFDLPEVIKGLPSEKVPEHPDKSGSDLKGRTIMIAEDDEVNYLFMEAVLLKRGCRILHAKNGKEAVELFNRNRNVDLIIMDLKMPLMNGLDATFKIKAIDNTVPVIAHSAYVLNNEREQSLAAGCVDYLPKPVKTEDLLSILRKHLIGRYKKTVVLD